MSLHNIGKILGRDHSTVMSSIEKAEKMIRNDPMTDIEVKDIIKEVTDQN
jgi:chromosomal replication initiation ATPase DnaA